MSWLIGNLKQMSNTQLMLFIIGNAMGGFGIGLLIATWLPTWTGWIFFILAWIIAIPSLKPLLNMMGIGDLKQMSNTQLMLFIIGKAMGGFGIGLLIATWLSTWTGWMFFILAWIIAVPSLKPLLNPPDR